MSEIHSILRRLAEERLAVLPRQEADAFAGHLDLIQEDDTFISGPILILSGEGGIIVLEYPGDASRTAVLRLFDNLEDAKSFVRDRLATYEKMWDGCGCRIDYYK